MSLKASESKNQGSSKEYELLEASTYPARVVAVVELGMQTMLPWAGKEKPPAQKILFTYEFVDEFLKDEDGQDDTGKPRWLSESMPIYSLEAEKAKSTIRYFSMDPDQVFGGDFAALIDLPVMVTVIQDPGRDGKVRNRISGVARMRAKDADKCPALVNEANVFDLDAPDMEVYNRLPQWVQKMLTENLEFRGSDLERLLGHPAPEKTPEGTSVPAEGALDDEIPF